MNAISIRQVNEFPLPRYDAMCHAIAECHNVDEVKDIHDKALAVEVYLRQAGNTDAERKAVDVRLRAERRSGELLKELERADASTAGSAGGFAKAGVSNDATRQKSEYAETLARTGISRQTANRYQALAAVPGDVFERHLADPEARPSTSRIIREARAPEPKIDADALRLWGKARAFERQHDADFDPRTMFDAMTNAMQSDMRRLVPRMVDYWESFEEAIAK